MNQTELIAAVAAKTGQTKNATEETIKATLAAIVTELADGGDVRLAGFGNFVTTHRKARTSHNPATGAELVVPEKSVMKLRPASKAAEAVSGAYAKAAQGVAVTA
jgi:DNA-binding protein HU-beta